MKMPDEYTNKQGLGRVVDAILDPAGSSTGLVYEKTYNEIRGRFEALRQESPDMFASVTGHMRGAHVLTGRALADAEKSADKHGIAFSNELQRAIVRDWSAKGGLSKAYEPAFMLDTTRPVRRAFYEAVGACVEKLRSAHPEYAQPFDALLKSGDPHHLIYPDQFSYNGSKMGYGFRNAVIAAGFNNALAFPEARTYVNLNPASAPAPVTT